MLAVLYIFTIGFEYTRGRAGLRKYLSQHFQIKTERRAQGEPFCQSRSIDIHDHVNERFYLSRFASFPDKADDRTKFFQNRFGFSESVFASAAHQIKRAFARLRNARGHARFERFRASFSGQLFDLDMDLRRDGGAINKEPAARVNQQIVTASCKDVSHRVVVTHDSKDHVRFRSNFRQILSSCAAEFGRE